MEYLMAIDAGTGSVRSVIFDADGNQIGVAAREWEHRQDPRFPGSMDFDCAANWELCKETIAEVLTKTGITDIGAVATTSMREAIVLYDRDGHELWACANVDARSDGEAVRLKGISPTIEADIYKISGQTFSLGALARLLWVKTHLPEIYAKTKWISMLNDWLTYKLTGVISTEPSNGCTTGIFDLKKRVWDTSVVELCGLREDIFPVVYEPGMVVGVVAGDCGGLNPGTPVAAGGGDAQLGAVGTAVVRDGQAAVFGGSFWQLEYNTTTPVLDSKCRIRVNCHAVPELWQYEAIAFFPGLIMRWYRDAFCQLEKRIQEETGEDAYVQMDREAAKISAGSNGMLCAFSNSMDYISWRHAAPTFTNFSIDPAAHNRYTFCRSIMENAALVTKAHLLLVEEITGRDIDELVFAGGASKSPLWSGILADVLNVRVKVPVVKEATALGAAVCAGVAAGIYPDMASGCERVVRFERTYTPAPENRGTYDSLFRSFKEVYAAQLALADAGVTKHMWSAPGC